MIFPGCHKVFMDRQTMIGRKLKTLREAKGLSQPELAALANTVPQNISRLERGERKLSLKWAELLAPHLDVQPVTLMTSDMMQLAEFMEQSKQPQGDAMVKIPDLAIFGGMGSGGELDVNTNPDHRGLIDPDQIRGYWTLPDYLVSGLGRLKGVYAWEVRGDSMEPTLMGGSVVFVDTKQDTLPPDDLYAINYGDGLMVKRLKLIPRSDRVAVISDNDRYGTDELLRQEVHIWGRIVGWFQWRG